MDEPVPVRRAVAGCLLIAIAGLAVALLVRPAIFTVAPPRDDSTVALGMLTQVSAGPIRHEVLLARSYGWDGERVADDGRVQLSLVVSPSRFGGVAVVAAASPVADDCPLEVEPDRLVDCEGREWTLEGHPLDPADPPLDRFPVAVESGTVVADLTRSLGE